MSDRSAKVPLDGLLVLNKPIGISSAKALYRVRKHTRVRKSGHAGTLDPAASGVLLICMGKATKLVERIMDLSKAYRATIRLDVTSASLDAETPLESVEVAQVPSREAVVSACARWEGEVSQLPPATSALKVGGRRAYQLARAGQEPQLAPRPVRIYRNQIVRYEWPLLEIITECGRGTYIRSLARDLGAELGVGGCLTALERTRIGPFRIQDSVTLETLADADDPHAAVIPLGRVQTLLNS